MILKDVNGQLIFPADIAWIDVYMACSVDVKYKRPYEGFDGWALCVDRWEYDSEIKVKVLTRWVLAWFDSCERAHKALHELLDGFTLTMLSVVKQ